MQVEKRVFNTVCKGSAKAAQDMWLQMSVLNTEIGF